jgi:hypothetical protein
MNIIEFNDLLIRFANAIARYELASEEGQQYSMLELDPEFRHAWEQLSFACWSAGHPPPHTLPDLTIWLHRPVAEWAQACDVENTGADWQYALMEFGILSEWGVERAAALMGERQIRLALQDMRFRELHILLRNQGDARGYTALRSFLVRHPIIADMNEQITLNPMWGPQIRSRLAALYEAIPNVCIRLREGSEYIPVCPHCGWTLVQRGGELRCHEGGGCTIATNSFATPLWIPYSPEMARTIEGIQRFVVAPEVDLITLSDRLIEINGVLCTLFPDFDAYDLRIESMGQVWAVDLKDHSNPRRLARDLKHFAHQPEWSDAFFVIPDYRASPSYMQSLRTLWHGEPNVHVMSVRQFEQLVRETMQP